MSAMLVLVGVSRWIRSDRRSAKDEDDGRGEGLKSLRTLEMDGTGNEMNECSFVFLLGSVVELDVSPPMSSGIPCDPIGEIRV